MYGNSSTTRLACSESSSHVEVTTVPLQPKREISRSCNARIVSRVQKGRSTITCVAGDGERGGADVSDCLIRLVDHRPSVHPQRHPEEI
mmetsp:Transcript_14443/g.31349  ORF Transcript_14443/g.31349 Transcript_14443/m.31349 type:complete len:89 (-) Transcript_14443:1546-1812(-)